jgi:hypothetical protein
LQEITPLPVRECIARGTTILEAMPLIVTLLDLDDDGPPVFQNKLSTR